jgi:hypothetical protein
MVLKSASAECRREGELIGHKNFIPRSHSITKEHRLNFVKPLPLCLRGFCLLHFELVEESLLAYLCPALQILPNLQLGLASGGIKFKHHGTIT